MAKKERNSKSIKNRKVFDTIFTVVLAILAFVSLCISGIVVFQKNYYEKFYVSGQSMYPYLNSETSFENGEKLGATGAMDASKLDDLYYVDYGIMDTHDYVINKSKRFDVFVWDTTPEITDQSRKSLFIKRVIGLPGETIRINNKIGTLEIKDNNGEYHLIEQPIENKYLLDISSNIIEVELADDEYYLCGDNRAHSTDSRVRGPAKRNEIVGKAVAIIGRCETHKRNGKIDVEKIKYFSWPRFLK